MFVYKARNNIPEMISIIQLEKSRCILFGYICMVIISTMRIIFFNIFQETQITSIQNSVYNAYVSYTRCSR